MLSPGHVVVSNKSIIVYLTVTVQSPGFHVWTRRDVETWISFAHPITTASIVVGRHLVMMH
jgi:hypothetical protein